MKSEGFGQEYIAEREYTKEEIFRARNEMQIKLAARFYGFEIEDEKFGEWVALYSKKFADVLDQHPEFIGEYVHGENDKILEEISNLLYEKHEVHA